MHLADTSTYVYYFHQEQMGGLELSCLLDLSSTVDGEYTVLISQTKGRMGRSPMWL